MCIRDSYIHNSGLVNRSHHRWRTEYWGFAMQRERTLALCICKSSQVQLESVWLSGDKSTWFWEKQTRRPRRHYKVSTLIIVLYFSPMITSLLDSALFINLKFLKQIFFVFFFTLFPLWEKQVFTSPDVFRYTSHCQVPHVFSSPR